MLVSWPYHIRGSLIETFDPRARWIASFLILAAVMMLWDIRILIFYFLLVIIQILITKITFKELRIAFIFIFLLVVVGIGLNTLITGAGGSSTIEHLPSTVMWEKTWNVPLINWAISPTITVEKLGFAITQVVRSLTLAFLFLVIPYTINPRLNGITFNGLGLGYKAAFSTDLAFRFIPTLARNFGITLDAQKARGFDIGGSRGGLIKMIRRLAPLLVPVVMNAIVGAEDIINAMDLRCFGIKKRTWTDVLTYRRRDYFLIAFAGLCLLSSLIIKYVLGQGDIWIIPSLYNLV